MTTTQTWLPHLFHRRHNTMPRVPMPGVRGRSDVSDVVGSRPDGRPWSGDLTDHLQATSTRAPVLLADLTSPWAYLVHLRLDLDHDLDPDGGPDGGADSVVVAGPHGVGEEARPPTSPVWEAVESTTTRPWSGLRTGGPDRDRLREELALVRELALDGEDIPDDVPAVLPHPRPVAAAYAEAVTLGRGRQARGLLLRAYWQDGLDVGDPEVLRRLMPRVLVDDGALCTGDPRREWGYVVSPARGPLTDAAYHLMGRWQQRWVDLGRPGPLALVDGDRTRTGADVLGGPVEHRLAA